MYERSQVIEKKSDTKKGSSAPKAQNSEFSPSTSSASDRILSLQRTLGNQAVQRLFTTGTIQPKLRIGQPNDIYEQEADRVADEVMRMPEPAIQPKPTVPFTNDSSCEDEEPIQTKPLASRITPLLQRQPIEQEEEELIQAKTTGDVTPEVTPAVSSDIQSLQGGGRPLSEREHSFFEPRFGADFSNARVHNDTRAANVARSINARAFTFGHNVVFGAGEYSSDTSSGRKLLAHELTHVAQQNDGSTLFSTGKNRENTIPNSKELSIVPPVFQKLTTVKPSTAFERKADEVTKRVAQEKHVRAIHQIGTSVLQRDIDPTYRERLEQMSDQQLNQEWLDVETTLNDTLPTSIEWSDLVDQQRMILYVLANRGFPLVAPGTRSRNILGYARGAPAGGRLPIRAYYFQGRTAERALIVGGVHGSEQSSVEVTNILVENLLTGPIPRFTTIVVPVLFPANLEAAQAANPPICPSRGCDPISPGRSTPGEADPNRQYPPIGYSLDTARSEGAALGPVDEQDRPMEPETVMLLELIERFRPIRIASVHAHSMRGRQRRGRDMPGIFGERSDPTDDALALSMAQHAQMGGARVPGNWLGSDRPEPDYPPSAPSISAGITLGGWAPHPISEGGPQDRPAMTIITVEVQHYHPSSAELTEADRNRRVRELEAHSDALRDIFLEQP